MQSVFRVGVSLKRLIITVCISFHVCSTLICHRSMICAVALTTQNIIVSVMEWALFLTQYLGSVGVQEVSSP
jgi:hypothetical protein